LFVKTADRALPPDRAGPATLPPFFSGGGGSCDLNGGGGALVLNGGGAFVLKKW